MSAEVQFTQLFDFLDSNPDYIDRIKDQYMELLSGLSTVTPLPTSTFLQQVRNISRMGVIIVGVIKSEKTPFRIVASGTIVVEPKLIRGGKCVGHIEDIVVAPDMRNQGIGQQLLNVLKLVARENDCYKVILDCAETVRPVYEKNGLRTTGIQMAEYISD